MLGLASMTTVENVGQATQIALDFVKKHYVFVYPIAAKKENSRWIVDLDISYFKPGYVRVSILAESATIEDFKVTLGQLL